jgi:hypothetical protein
MVDIEICTYSAYMLHITDSGSDARRRWLRDRLRSRLYLGAPMPSQYFLAA